jgi:hypothetical protein
MKEIARKVDAVDKKVDAVDKKVDAVSKKVGKKVDAVSKKVGTVDKKVVNLKAYTYESNVMLLVPYYMHDWWGCKPEYLANKTFVSTMEGYGKCSFHTFRISRQH